MTTAVVDSFLNYTHELNYNSDETHRRKRLVEFLKCLAINMTHEEVVDKPDAPLVD